MLAELSVQRLEGAYGFGRRAVKHRRHLLLQLALQLRNLVSMHV